MKQLPLHSIHHFKKETYQHAPVWIGAAIVGLVAVGYAKMINWVQELYFHWFHLYPYWTSAFSPFAFVFATYLVHRFAPEAKGSGIPQVLQAIESVKGVKLGPEGQGGAWHTPLVSVKTAVIKVLSSIVGILGGASIGREGPTVQVAASGFAWVGRQASRFGLNINFGTYLIAGAASGVAAAFNTPIAGITFALEEMAVGSFGSFRQTVMLAVIISGITAQALVGDYLYFGHPIIPQVTLSVIPEALLMGVVGGGFGGAFAKLLAYPQLSRLPEVWWLRALACGFFCSAVGLMTQGDTAGSGYEVTRRALESSDGSFSSLLFPIFKLCTTVISYLSGMGGGIFSPSLSIGAGLGMSVAKLAHFENLKICALTGMVAFFSGAVQAPLTAVIIVTEMTDENTLILPFMMTAFLAQMIGKKWMPVPLYSHLAGRKEEG